ncbi:UDP-4-amino-4,6-dideoxy-N-acetyl-beta-L-altrosamine transaminase [Caminibacter sp.]
MIPYGRQHIDKEDIQAVVDVLESDFLTTGPKVKEFEEVLCKYTGAKYAVAVSNGTAALHLASIALLNPGDVVLTTPNSFLATSNSILYANARPLFVDIKEDGNIDLDKCEEILKRVNNIKAIYAVHFSGNPVDMEKLFYLKEKYGVLILEDAAHAIGATYEWRVKSGEWRVNKIGDCSFSDAAIFSFHPVKNLTTAEGGTVLTNDKKIYKKLFLLRNHGIEKGGKYLWEYKMNTLGFNYRITDMQCALGINQLKKLDKFIKKRQQIAKKYEESFKNTPIKPLYPFNENSAYHLFVVRYPFKNLEEKNEMFKKMREKGIFLQLHYIPIPSQPYYKNLGYSMKNLSNMQKYYLESFSLPIYYDLDEKQQEYVINSLKEVLYV